MATSTGDHLGRGRCSGRSPDTDPAWLSADVVAGLTVWAVLVPEALAYATIAGVSPVVGLYAAVPALVLYALGRVSRHLVVGPMAATAALSAAAVADVAAGNRSDFALTAGLALVTGCWPSSPDSLGWGSWRRSSPSRCSRGSSSASP